MYTNFLYNNNIMPSGARTIGAVNMFFLIVSTHVIFWAHAACIILSRPAEGSCFCLATVSEFSLLARETVVAFRLMPESTLPPLHSPQ